MATHNGEHKWQHQSVTILQIVSVPNGKSTSVNKVSPIRRMGWVRKYWILALDKLLESSL